MIHPSYQELIATINEGQDLDEAPVVSSRYSLVLATSKRARQIIGGAEPLVKVKKGMKPLSIAVEEMYKGEVTILPESEVEAEEETKEEPVIESYAGSSGRAWFRDHRFRGRCRGYRDKHMLLYPRRQRRKHSKYS